MWYQILMNQAFEQEHTRLRIAVLVGPFIILVFMAADLMLLPDPMHTLYLTNRLALQLPVVLLTVGAAFYRACDRVLHWIFAALLLWLVFTNYWLIYQSWVQFDFAFPYEGTILYAFYCAFALRMPAWLMLASSLIALAGFIGLMAITMVYGERSAISASFVAGGLFICVYAKFRLDNTLRLLKNRNQELARLSTQDALTELFNRRALMHASSSLLAVAARQQSPVAVLLLDLDDFKRYNDHFGHQQGDEAIMHQAVILREVFKRDSDILGRYGGEEFMVAVSGLTQAELDILCAEILERWQQAQLRHAPNAKKPVMSCSVGAVYCQNAAQANLGQLIERVDQALYQAKHEGKGRYVITPYRRQPVYNPAVRHCEHG